MNSKQHREQAAVGKRQGNVLDRNGTPTERKVSEQQNSSDERISKMLAGVIEPPNRFVAYLLEKLKKARTEYEQLQAQITQGRQVLAELERRLLVVQGEHNKYVEDVRAWDKQIDENEPEKTSQPDADGKYASAGCDTQS